MINKFQNESMHKIEPHANDSEFKQLLKPESKGILCIPSYTSDELSHKVHMPETYQFAKWILKNRKDISIEVIQAEGVMDLRSDDFWLPLVYLASDISLQIYIGIVASYIYDCLKGALKHDKSNVNLEAVYHDSKDGITKKFTYKGTAEGF